MSSSATVTISIDRVADDREVQLAGPPDDDAVGDRRRRRDLHGLACGERRRVRGGVLGLHPDDAHLATDLGRELGERARDAGDQAAAADRHDDVLDIGDLLEDLEGERSLAGHDIRVIERRDDDRAGALGECGRALQRLVDDVAVQHDLGAVVAGRLQLGQGDTERHEDRGRDAELAGGERDALGVVARRGCDDAAGALLGAQLGEQVERPADLVRPGALQVLGLEVDVLPEQLAQVARLLHGRDVDHRRDAFACLADLREGGAGEPGRRLRLRRHGQPLSWSAGRRPRRWGAG